MQKNNKLKIGIVCHPSVGGSGIVATNLGSQLNQLGHEIHFISYEPPFKMERNKKNIFFHKVQINEYSLFKYPDYTLPLAVEIEKVQKKFNLDIVHVHYAVPHATAALLAIDIIKKNKIKQPKIVTTLHGTDITLLAKDPALLEIIKYSVEKSDGVTAVSQDLKKDSVKLLNTKKNIEVIYNFYNPQTPAANRTKLRKKLGIKKDEVVAIHLSNLRPVKRIPDLLKIMSLIKNKKNCKLLILSGGDFSSFLPLIKKYKIEGRVQVLQNVKDIENYISACDLGIYTSETETFGMGALETMSFGLPVLTTDSGGTPEVVENKISGFLCKVGDVKSFAKKLSILIENENLRKKMGENAKKIAQEKFCAEIIVPQYINFYEKIIGKV